jgi:hypothetical protein
MTCFTTAQAVLDAYAEGTRRLDRDLLAACFHPAAVMAGSLDGQILAGSPAPFLADVAAMRAAGVDHATIAVTVDPVEQVGSTATGRVHTRGFGGRFDFDDRFHLLRDAQGHWTITAKLFSTLP